MKLGKERGHARGWAFYQYQLRQKYARMRSGQRRTG
jgi:hypothetical protein